MKNYKEILEKKQKKMSAAVMVKLFKNTADWGDDMKDQVYVKKGNLVFVDTYFYGGEAHLKQVRRSWSQGGSYYNYFSDNYGLTIKIVDSFIEVFAKGRHKKLTKDGIVGVVLKIQ